MQIFIVQMLSLEPVIKGDKRVIKHQWHGDQILYLSDYQPL